MAEESFLRQGESLRDLRTLEALEKKPDISQRDLAARLGVAVGLTNACIRRMAHKGWIKIKRVNSRNITYHLTPSGFSEKARLSVRYTEETIDFYRRAKQLVSNALASLQALGAKRIVVIGASDLAEIVGICCNVCDIEIVAIADFDREDLADAVLGMETRCAWDVSPEDFDAAVVAYTESYEDRIALVKKFARGKVIAWPLEDRVEPLPESTDKSG